jgi:hypothetical protein
MCNIFHFPFILIMSDTLRKNDFNEILIYNIIELSIIKHTINHIKSYKITLSVRYLYINQLFAFFMINNWKYTLVKKVSYCRLLPFDNKTVRNGQIMLVSLSCSVWNFVSKTFTMLNDKFYSRHSKSGWQQE